MEPEGSLPQVPVTCPYPEPARYSYTPISHFLKIHLNIILPYVLTITIPEVTIYCQYMQGNCRSTLGYKQ